MSDDHLLPSNAADLEVTLDQSAARIGDVAVPIRDLGDPQRTPEAIIPWLAWAWSIDVWDESWTDAQRRAAIAQSFWLHRRKGTLTGLRAVAALAGGDLRSVIVPPNAAHFGPVWGEAAREEWLGRHPEMRVYRHRVRGRQAGLTPVAGAMGAGQKTYLGGRASYPAASTALHRMLPRVFEATADGQETERTTAVFRRGTVTRRVVRRETGETRTGAVLRDGQTETLYRIVRPALRGRGAFFGAPSGGGFYLSAGRRNYLSDTRAYRRTYITRIADVIDMPAADPDLARATVQPLLRRQTAGVDLRLTEGDAMTARAEAVAETGRRQGAFHGVLYPGRPPGASRPAAWLVDHDPGARMYARTRLFDPSIPTPPQRGVFFAGGTRLGMPAYHAEAKLAFRRRRLGQQFWRYLRGHFVARPPHLDRARMNALRWAVPARDSVLINTTTARPATVGGAALAGDITAGEWRDAT